MKKFEIFLLIIVLVAFSIRLYKLENFNYHFEQADDIYAAKKNWNAIKTLNFNDLELKGQDAFRYNSIKNKHGQNFETQIYHGVIYQYLLIPVGIISNFNPRFIVLFFALISILALILFYKIISKIYSNFVIELLLLVIFSFNGWLILYGRWIWTPSTLIFWSVLSIYLIEKSRKEKKYWLFTALSIGVASQIHISGILLIPSIIIYAYINQIHPPRSLKFYLAFVGLILLPAVPLIIYEIQNNFVYLNTFKLFFTNISNSSVSIEVSDVFQKLINFYRHLFLVKNYKYSFLNTFLYFSLIILVIGFIHNNIHRKIKLNIKPQKIVFLFSITLLFFYPILIGQYYSVEVTNISIINNTIVLFPFLLFSIGKILQYLKIKYLIIIVTTFLISYLSYNLIFIFERIENGYDGLNYFYKEELVKEITNYTQHKNFEILYLNPDEGQHNNSELISIFETYKLKFPERLNNQSNNFSQYSNIILPNQKAEIAFYIYDKSNQNSSLIPSDLNFIYQSQYFSLFAKITPL